MHNHWFLTQDHSDEVTQQIRATVPGMAHFANTGPFGATCGDCVFLGYFQQIRDAAGNTVTVKHRKGCEKYFRLTGTHGATIPANTSACRYFERKEK